MKAYFGEEGDSSVGIPGNVITIDFGNLVINDIEREDIRESIAEFIGLNFTDNQETNKNRVHFEDECSECRRKLLHTGECRNKQCKEV